MGKVVTSQGLTEFVQSGKFDTVANHKAGQKSEAPPLEAVKNAQTLDISPAKGAGAVQSEGKPAVGENSAAPKAAEEAHEHDEPLTDEEKTLPAKAQKE